MNYVVWELLTIEKSFSENNENNNNNNNIDEVPNDSCSIDSDSCNLSETKINKVDYDYTDENAKFFNKIKERVKTNFQKIEKKIYISNISNYVKAYVKRSDSNVRSEIGITTDAKLMSNAERLWINNYIYNFISHCLLTYSDCKHYIVVKNSTNIVQKLTGTGYGYYGVYFTNGKKVGGMENLLINIKHMRHISYNLVRTLQSKVLSDTSISNCEDVFSLVETLY